MPLIIGIFIIPLIILIINKSNLVTTKKETPNNAKYIININLHNIYCILF